MNNGFPTREQVERIKDQYPKGTRIRLNHMSDPWSPVPEGTEGTVDMVDSIGQIHMKWDNGRTLPLVPGEDSFSVIRQEAVQSEMMQMGGISQ